MTHTDVMEEPPQDAPVAPRRPTHAARSHPGSLRRALAVGGAVAAGLATVVGAVALQQMPDRGTTDRTQARKITVTPTVIPLTDAELIGLLHRRAELGPLTESGRRAACLTGLGYPASAPILGARQVQMDGRDAVVLLLGGDDPAALRAVAVAGTCSAADTGLLADTTLRRP